MGTVATRLQTASSEEYEGYTMQPSMLVFQRVDNGSNMHQHAHTKL